MSGLLRRIRGARAASGPEPEQGAPAPSEGPMAHADGAAQPGGQPPLPAGVDLDALVGERPTTRRRSRLRRRLRHLRRVREVLLRDLGGLVFEVHRSGLSGDLGRQQVVADKLRRLEGVNEELHALEAVLGDPRGMVLREPGIGGSCPTCGELFGSDARFCWACGTPVAPGAQRPPAPAGALPALAAAPAPAAPAPEPHIEGSVIEQPPPRPPEAPTVVEPTPVARREPDAPTAVEPAASPPGSPVDDRPGDEDPTTILRPGDPLTERRP